MSLKQWIGTSYTKKWDLKVNQTKTKILTFQKGGQVKELKLQFEGYLWRK